MRKIMMAVLLASISAPAWAQDDYKSLPPGTGRDVTVRVCAQCHSPEIVAQQKLDPAGWKDLVNQMANNGAQATDAEFNTITSYLSTAFPASGAAPGTTTPAAGGTAPATPPAQ